MIRSAIAVETIHGDSHMMLITDDKRLIKCVTMRHGLLVATDFRWETFRGDLNVICQNSPSKFFFTARGIPSWRGPTTCIRDSIVSCDFEKNEMGRDEIDKNDISVQCHRDFLLRKVYGPVPDTPNWNYMWLIGDVEQISLRTSVTTEPQELNHKPSIYLPSNDGEVHKLVYFYNLPWTEDIVEKLAVVPLDPKLNSHSLPPYKDFQCLPDSLYGYPKAGIFRKYSHTRFQENLYVKNETAYWVDINVDFVATSVWILRFGKGENFNPKWEKFCFVNSIQLTKNRPFLLIVNDEGEILIIQNDDKQKHLINRSNINVLFCGRMKVPSLKHLTAQIVIECNPHLLSMSENEQRSKGIPYGCFPSCAWMKNFSKPMSTED